MNAREKWLLSLLTSVFVLQTGIVLYGVHLCSRNVPARPVAEVCPQLGDRIDTTFGTMLATTLALLTGATVATAVKKPSDTKPPEQPKILSKPPYIPPPPGRQ